jgi:hypothetical protein
LGGYVDAAGNIVGSAQFLANFIVDYAGNLGSIQAIVTDCTVLATIIGSALPPGEWEMQSGTTETVGQNDDIISNNYTANTAAPLLHTFVSKNATGYLTGNVAGTGTWTIKAGPEAIAGTGYLGAGLLVFTGTNTSTGPIVMEVGTKLQLGADCSNTLTRILSSLTLAEGAKATQYTSWTSFVDLTGGTLNNNGTYHLIGCGACGVGYAQSANVTNNELIILDKVIWKNRGTWNASTGTVNVLSGSTYDIHSSATIPPATQRFNINGCGWKNSSCGEEGAIRSLVSVDVGFRVNVQSASCIKVGTGITLGLNGTLTGSAPLRLTNGLSNTGTAAPAGTINMFNNSNTYTGTITASNINLRPSSNSIANAFRIVLENGASLRTSTSGTAQNLKSIESLDPNTDWTGDNVTQTLSANGITTFAGVLQGGGSGPHNIRLAGGSQNQLTLTNRASTNSSVTALNGAKVILEGGKLSAGGFGGGGLIAQNGGTVSAGKSIISEVVSLSLNPAGEFDVHAISPTQAGLLTTTTGQFILATGSTTFPINLLHPMDAGTYPILKITAGTGVGYGKIPTTVINNTGKTASYFWDTTTRTLMMTLS